MPTSLVCVPPNGGRTFDFFRDGLESRGEEWLQFYCSRCSPRWEGRAEDTQVGADVANFAPGCAAVHQLSYAEKRLRILILVEHEVDVLPKKQLFVVSMEFRRPRRYGVRHTPYYHPHL